MLVLPCGGWEQALQACHQLVAPPRLQTPTNKFTHPSCHVLFVVDVGFRSQIVGACRALLLLLQHQSSARDCLQKISQKPQGWRILESSGTEQVTAAAAAAAAPSSHSHLQFEQPASY